MGLFLRKLAICLFLIYCLAVALTYALQRQLIYPSYIPDQAYPAGQPPAGMEELSVMTEDRLALKAWYSPPTSRQLTLVIFHGNGDNRASFAPVAEPFIAAGYGVLLAEYRGYGGMPGSPSESGLYADGIGVMRALIAKGITPEKIILFGFSLGSGIATELALHYPVAGMILAAPFTALTAVAAEHYPFFPVSLLLSDRYQNINKISRIRAPLLILHGTHDRVVSVEQARALFAAANEPKTFKILDGADHNNMGDFGLTEISLEWAAGLMAGNNVDSAK